MEHRPNWSFKKRQLNEVTIIISQLTEDVIIFLSNYPIVALIHLSMQHLPPCTRSQQCFTTTTIRSFGPFGKLELRLSRYCHFTRFEKIS